MKNFILLNVSIASFLSTIKHSSMFFNIYHIVTICICGHIFLYTSVLLLVNFQNSWVNKYVHF